MLTGTRPFSGPPLPFCLPVIATRPIVLSTGAESSGQWGLPTRTSRLPIWVPLDRFWVGLVAEIPARKNFKKHKNLKNFSNPFGTKRKVVGKGRFSLVEFLPEVKNDLECDFSRVKVSDSPSGDREARAPQPLALERRLQNYFRASARKSVRVSPPFPKALASRGPVSATRLKVFARNS
jgi:hypothetical protein